MSGRLSTLCKCLLTDLIPESASQSKKSLPANNHLLALSYAHTLDLLLSTPSHPTDIAKPHYTLYHRLLLHSSRHMLHKYKRGGESKRFQYKCWGIADFEGNEGKWFSYLEYPLTEDLFALKREVTIRTKIGKLVDEKVDDALDNITDAAMRPHTAFTRKDFSDDFEAALPYLQLLCDYVTKANLP